MAAGRESADHSFEVVQPVWGDDLLEGVQDLNLAPGMNYSSQINEFVEKLKLKFQYHMTAKPFFEPEEVPPGIIPVDSIKERFEDLAELHFDARYRRQDDSPEDLLRPLFHQKFHQLTNRQFVLALLDPVMRNNHLVLRFDDLLSLNLQPSAEARNEVKKWRPSFVIFGKFFTQPTPLGVVQVTSGGNLNNADAVKKCMTYMRVLRTKAQHTVFGIVTDALHYVLILLDTEGTFHLEGYADRQKPKKRTAKTWERQRYIALVINNFCRRSKREAIENLEEQEEEQDPEE